MEGASIRPMEKGASEARWVLKMPSLNAMVLRKSKLIILGHWKGANLLPFHMQIKSLPSI